MDADKQRFYMPVVASGPGGEKPLEKKSPKKAKHGENRLGVPIVYIIENLGK